MQGAHAWLGGIPEGLQGSSPAVGLAAEGYGVHEAGQDERHPGLCTMHRAAQQLWLGQQKSSKQCRAYWKPLIVGGRSEGVLAVMVQGHDF